MLLIRLGPNFYRREKVGKTLKWKGVLFKGRRKEGKEIRGGGEKKEVH